MKRYIVTGGKQGEPARDLGTFPTWLQAWEAVAKLAIREPTAMRSCQRFTIRPVEDSLFDDDKVSYLKDEERAERARDRRAAFDEVYP